LSPPTQTVRDDILAELQRASHPLGPREIAVAIDADYGYVRKQLSELHREGEVTKPGRGRYDVPARNKREQVVAETIEPFQRPGLIADMFSDDERRPPTKLEQAGLLRVAGSVVAEGHDRDGIMYAVEVVFHVRAEPAVTTHRQTITPGPSAAAPSL